MAARYDDSFSEFIDFVNRAEEIEDHQAYSFVLPLQRNLRDRQNPMEVFNDQEFLARYRFSKAAVLELLSMLPLHQNTDGRGCPVPLLLQLLVTLRFDGAGTFQVVSGDLVNVSQPTVSRVFTRVSTMIAGTLFPALVKFPDTEKMHEVMHQFYKKAKFPRVTGCIDCTHVRIKSPGGNDAEVFRNRKGYFSFNVQAITGPQLEFFDLVASWPGSAHDSRIFDNSSARARYEEGTIPGVLLGDMGYACRPYLMTPIKNSGSTDSPEYRYNKSQIRTRNTVERAFGIWKRFPCLDMKLRIETKTSAIVVTACAALHNFGRNRQSDELPPDPCKSQQPSIASQGQGPQPVDSASGFRTRARLIQQYFS
ncbi:putative nuclease HARBI1 [Dermacentor andersoni]|uniref:putative nuclease HARBI1 n=1 Tax=Dermacentor andersoni TaxID=34620 RepID=UPI002155ACCE|nr:putative nuclease HARBI1 [Dermacentor andersoni]